MKMKLIDSHRPDGLSRRGGPSPRNPFERWPMSPEETPRPRSICNYR